MKSPFSTLLTALAVSTTAVGSEPPLEPLESEARALVKRFGGTLKPTLVNAVQTDGAAGAIAVCAEQAPAIAQQLSQETGWQIRRVSLQARNAGSATPDGLERDVLEDFAQRQQSGESGATLSYSAVADGHYRYLQAQPVEPLCLVCHGSSLAPDVEAALRAHYPEDRATGYELGEIRGAFSLSTPRD